MNNALLFIGGLLVAVLSALFAVPHFIDWNGYRGVFEEEASRVLGREVRVGGAVNVRLLPTPYVRFEKVRVADATGGTGEPFFRSDAFTLWLSVPPLLRGVLEAHEIELQRPRLRLAADAEGRGNWTTLDVSQGSLPFVPAGVSLQAVRIADGSIGVAMGAGGGELQLDGVNGDFQADAIEGPYKFQGTMNWRGSGRQVRFSTAKPDADGGVRMKSIVTAPVTGNTYVLDGKMMDLRGKTRFDGTIHGKMRIESLGARPQPEQGAEVAKAARPPQDGQAPFIDAKAVLAADLTAARLGEILLSVENVGQPQLVTGDARVAWAGSPVIELALTSRWLDLDRLAGRDPADQPIDTAQALVSALLGQLPTSGRVDVRFDVEQTSLGGEAVSGLGVKLARDRDNAPLEIREMRAGLPGGARIDITGTLAEGAALPQLDGALVVRGSSLTRFLKWAGKNPALIEGRTDGPFLVRGKLRLSESELALSEAAAELNGVPLTGDVRHELKNRRRVSVRLDGQSVDLAHVWPGALDWIAAVVPFAASQAKPAAAPAVPAAVPAADPVAPKAPAVAAAADAGGTDLTLRVRVAELIAGTRTLRDVDADLAVERGRLAIPRLRLSTSDGLEVDVEGEIDNATTKPKGVLRGHIGADRPSAVEALFRLLGETAAVDAPRGQIAALAPLRLAGRVRLGQRTASAADIDADGIVQGGRFVASARLDGGWRGWREGPAELSVEADSPDVDQLLRLALGTGGEPQRGRTPRRGQLNLKAQGVPSRGMLTAAELQSAGLSLSYDGPMKLEKGAPSAIDGEVRITADNVAEALELAGIPLGGAASAVAVDGILSVTAHDNVLSITPRELVVGVRKVAGSLIVAQRSGRPSTVTANLELGDVRLADLMTPLLDRRGLAATAAASDIATRMAQAAAAGAAGDADTGPWPDLSFDLQPLDRLDGTVDLTFKRLRLDDGVALGDGRISARLEPGRITVDTLSGSALGGRVTGSASLARVKGGVDGKVALRFADLKPGLLAGEASALRAASKPVSLSLDLEGRSQSPRGLIAAMRGKGIVDVARIELPGMTPGGVAKQAEAFVAGRIEPGEGALTRVLTEAGERETAAVLAGKYEIEAGDGALRVRPISIETNHGRTAITTTLDLDTLRFDSEWRIDLAADPAQGARAPQTSGAAVRAVQLPAVYLVYAGKLGAMAASERRISAGALERELQVRRMEIEVDELERTRREDERRRAQELERQQAMEAERARAIADPAVATPQSAAGVPDGAQTPAAKPLQVSPEAMQPSQAPAGSAQDAQRGGTAVRPPPAPKPVRRVSPGDEVLRSLSPN